MRAIEFISELTIDNKDGAGNVPNNRNVDYLGLRVSMTPSVFLRLAAPLQEPGSSESLASYIKDGGAIASPFLDIRLPAEWEDGDFSKTAKVVSHEGRNRMLAVQATEGDVPVEVHLFFRDGVRRRHLTDEMLVHLNRRLMPESEFNTPFSGPYWKMVD